MPRGEHAAMGLDDVERVFACAVGFVLSCLPGLLFSFEALGVLGLLRNSRDPTGLTSLAPFPPLDLNILVGVAASAEFFAGEE